MNIYTPVYNFNNAILKNIEAVSKMQGKLESLSNNLHDEFAINTAANIDAAHFSTKLEGNKLTIKHAAMALTGQLKEKNVKNRRDLKEI